MYTYERKVTYSEIGADGMTDAAQIVRYFQDCSTMQSEALSVGMDFLESHSHVWMLASWQVEIYRRPKLGEDIVTGTWPYAFDNLYGYRNFVLKDAEGKVLAVANSVWFLVNMQTGRPEKLTKEYVEHYPLEEKYPMACAPRRIALPKEWESKAPFAVRRCDLDTNWHVNNAHYIAFAAEYVPEGAEIRQVRVEYKKAAVYGDTVYPKICRDGEKLTVALCDADSHVMAAVEMLLGGII